MTKPFVTRRDLLRHNPCCSFCIMPHLQAQAHVCIRYITPMSRHIALICIPHYLFITYHLNNTISRLYHVVHTHITLHSYHTKSSKHQHHIHITPIMPVSRYITHISSHIILISHHIHITPTPHTPHPYTGISHPITSHHVSFSV